jgi:hypothetical protein
MAGWGEHATLRGMELLEQIGAGALVFGAALVFALMAWAGQHQS